MKRTLRKAFGWSILFLGVVLPASLAAQKDVSQTSPNTTAQSAQPNLQAISQTGLLPVYGVDVELDPSWVDARQFPSQSSSFPNFGTSAAVKQLWSALRPGGYNALRVPIDVRDVTRAANRVANLCVWAKNNNVQLILVLSAEDQGQPISQDYPNQTSTFAKTLVSLLKTNGGQYLPNYAQIMADEEIGQSQLLA